MEMGTPVATGPWVVWTVREGRGVDVAGGVAVSDGADDRAGGTDARAGSTGPAHPMTAADSRSATDGRTDLTPPLHRPRCHGS